MRAVAKLPSAFDAASLEALGATAHAEGFFLLRLELRREQHPVLILLLLIFQDFCIAG